MTWIVDCSPPAAPYQADTFASFAQLQPDPLRDLLAAIAHEVEIEGRALKVGASERSRMARVKQLALLGQAAATAGDDQRPADTPSKAQEIERRLARLRSELSEMMRRGIDWDVSGDMIGPEHFVCAWKLLRVLWRRSITGRAAPPANLGRTSHGEPAFR